MPTFRQDNKLGDSVPLIKTPDIGDKQVTERKLADGSVTSSKLSTEIANMLSLLTTRISAFKVADNLSSLPTEENTIGWLVDNHLYVYVGNGSTPESGMYQDCGELRGPQGIQGEQGLSGLNGKSAYDIWTEQPGNEDKSEIDFLEFTRGSKGDKGDQGERGYDISNIEQIVKSTEDGGKNIIRVTRSDGWSKVFEIFNGSKGSKGDKGTSIVKLEQTRKTTESSGLNTIEATLGDGTKESFEIYNGAKGEQGDKGEKGDKGDQGEIGPQGNSGIADASNKTLVNDAITGGETDFLSAEVGKLGILTYDCSKGGTVTHTTLQDAINSVPTTFQKVGLTITYKSGDTIYRYTLKANAWSADPTNWFSVEDKINDLDDTFAGVADKDATPEDGKVFYIGYESGVYPNFDNVECSLNGLNILKRMYNGKFGNYFIDFGSPYAFQGNQAVNWGILDDYTFIHNNTSVTIKGRFNIVILFPYAKRTNLTKEFSIDVPKDSVSIVYAEVRKGKAEMFYCNIVGGSKETSFLKEIENKNGLAVVPLFIIDRGSEDIIPLLMMATGMEDKENLDSYYNKASYAQKSDILPIKALIKTTFDKNFHGRIDTFSEEPSVFPYEAHKNGGLVVRDSIANEDGFLHQIKACVNGNGVFSLRVGLLDQRNMFVERSRTNIVLSLGNNTINVLDKHILIKKGETVALSITNDSATCSQFYERAQQSGEKTFLYSPSWDGVFSELATDFGGIVVFGFNMVSIESAFAYATDIEKTNETLNTIASKLNKQQYVYDADNNPYKLKVIDGELVPLPINYKKVLALGNSLTSHAKSEDIGYYGDESWAMASTNKVETTWTNYLERILKLKNVSASVTPFNIFDWETNPNNVDLDSLFSKVSDTDYDLILFRAGENGNYVDTYQEGFDRLIRFLQNKYKRATIVVSEMFWHNSQKEAVFKKVADEHGLQYVNTGNISDRCLLGQMLMGIDNQFHPIVHNGVAGHCTDVCYCKYGNILANALGYDEIQNELHTVSISTNKEYSINNTIQVYNGYVSILTYEDTKPVIEGVSADIISLKSANWINRPDKVPTYASVFKMPNSDVNITIS